MFVTTDDTVVGLIDQAVPDSKIVGSKKYTANTSLHYNLGSNSSTNKEDYIVFAEPYKTVKTILKNLKWNGVYNKDNLKFRLDQYHREMSLNQASFYRMTSFEGAIKTVQSDFSGFIGIGPYRSDRSDDNFLLQLKRQGIIDHLVLAFYMGDKDCIFIPGQNSCTTSSTIKFGSYDKININPGSKLEMIHTDTFTSWDIHHVNLQIGDDYGPHKVSHTNMFKFQPELPYIYFPIDQWKYFVDIINVVFADLGYKICDVTTNVCKFRLPCKDVPSRNWKLRFTLEYFDESYNSIYHEISIDPKDMLYEGPELGEADLKYPTCRIGVFKNYLSTMSKTALVGTVLLKKYYIVFD